MRNVHMTETHWVWTGYAPPNTSGMRYGRMKLPSGSGRAWALAHRYSWELRNGPVPDGLIVRHLCGLSLCVNPEHLAIGTHQDNADDRERDGNTRRGEKHGRSILTREDVIYIKTSGEKGCDLAKKYGVCEATISAVRTGRNWKGNNAATS